MRLLRTKCKLVLLERTYLAKPNNGHLTLVLVGGNPFCATCTLKVALSRF